MKQSILVVVLLVLNIVSFSQQDSLVFINTKWETQTIAPGIVWKHHHFNKDLFNSNQNINIVEIKLKKKRAIALACEPKTLKPTSEFGKQTGAIVAINGNFLI